MKYSHLFKRGKIGNLEIKNRLIMAPMGIFGLVNSDGSLSPEAIDYYESRAVGGIGLIITSMFMSSLDFEPLTSDNTAVMPVLDKIYKTFNLKYLNERVHDHGAKIFIQLSAGFGRVLPPAAARIQQPLTPSETTLYWRPKIHTREMNQQEVKLLIDNVGRAAGLAKASRFDGIELHAHEGYMMDQFATALWNQRRDKYGGDLEGRMTFALSIIKSIQENAGSDFPIVYRYGVDHKVLGGRKGKESIRIAQILEGAGVAALHVDAGCYDTWYWPHPPVYQPPGCMVEQAETIKKAVSIPVITVGKLGNPKLANQVIKEGLADFVAMGRPLLADPDLPNKARRGETDDIRPCIGCHDGCLDRIFKGYYLSCSVNPACGNEKRLKITKSITPKKIMVIGGGVAGMEAARVSALRGHRVELYEKTHRLGGLLHAAGAPDFKKDVRDFLRYQIRRVNEIGIKIYLRTEATFSMVDEKKPDVIFVATGSCPILKTEISDHGKVSMLNPLDILQGRVETGHNVIIVGGGVVGCETALFLSQKGKRVTVVERLNKEMRDIPVANRNMLLYLLAKNGVEMLTETEVIGLLPGQVELQEAGGNRKISADSLVLAVGFASNNGLVKKLEEAEYEVHAIGDCVRPRRILNAIWEAYKKAIVI